MTQSSDTLNAGRGDDPNDIVGHKTFSDGPLSFRHEPLTRAEADALMEAADKAKKERAERMPDEQAAIKTLFEAWLRLTELGWRDAVYCPKDGSFFKVIEACSTGIHHCTYRGEWPDGSWDIYGDGDIYPSRPILFHLYPEDQDKYDARMAAARDSYADRTHDWFVAPGLSFESCRKCGFIRRGDRKNKPCRGVVKVGPRIATPPGGDDGQG